ncbi:isochorismatase family protein [Planktomarina temperata]|jgi:maleamate amidohydrolase|uniref:isochorismatase family protein n=1 Tax=Planktomarina temperata TaxID=1284658 RepID=UPI002303F623|nr:isochorismatase family protein [Planktomarina temperata]MDA9947565.1 isochorismatase family protein [Planktomarina temperata]MDB0007458.1 isochorismatase family protein [Planktomarina temperata]MDB2507922.1 isochorismatase family protein [Planktomarina temperata]MDB4854089.1 isochorismatase family protein [Planktomarina temperata]
MASWDGVIGEDEIDRYAKAGFGGEGGIGARPALLIIDVQYRTVGTTSKPYWDAIKEYPTSCGDVGWDAVGNIAKLVALFRQKGFPILYPHVAPKNSATDGGRLAAKIPSIMGIDAKGYEFVEEIAPVEGDVLLPKKHPSAFFGTPLVSHLVDLGVDTLIVTGCTTSGCVRSSVTDAFAYNFKVLVPDDAVYDRSPTSHAVNLWDMNAKYADVYPSTGILKLVEDLEDR